MSLHRAPLRTIKNPTDLFKAVNSCTQGFTYMESLGWNRHKCKSLMSTQQIMFELQLNAFFLHRQLPFRGIYTMRRLGTTRNYLLSWEPLVNCVFMKPYLQRVTCLKALWNIFPSLFKRLCMHCSHMLNHLELYKNILHLWKHRCRKRNWHPVTPVYRKHRGPHCFTFLSYKKKTKQRRLSRFTHGTIRFYYHLLKILH